jgi:hypothetical protein
MRDVAITVEVLLPGHGDEITSAAVDLGSNLPIAAPDGVSAELIAPAIPALPAGEVLVFVLEDSEDRQTWREVDECFAAGSTEGSRARRYRFRPATEVGSIRRWVRVRALSSRGASGADGLAARLELLV